MVEGSYYCTMQHDRGESQTMHEGVVELYMEDGELKGTMISAFQWHPANFRGGKIEGNSFTFSVHWNTPTRQYSLHVSGTVDGDTLTGVVDSAIGPWKLDGYRVQDSYRNETFFPSPNGGFQRTLGQRERKE